MRRSFRALTGVVALCLAVPSAPASSRAATAPPGTSRPLGVVPPPGADRPSGVVRPALAAAIAARPSAVTEAFVTVGGRATASDVAMLASLGVRALRVFDPFGAIYVSAPGRALLRAARLPRVTAITPNARLWWAGDTDTVATRARDVWDKKSTATPMKVGSLAIDGKGVGVAVIDNGIDGTHPDLAIGMGGNKKLVEDLVTTHYGCEAPVWFDTTDSDSTSGHGTHVAGIVAGRGTQSDGRFTGSAPGASLYGLGVGEVNTVLYSLEAMLWVDCNYDLVSPRIRVVNNSWGGTPGPFDPEDPISRATDVLVADRLVVTFAAGNDGGNGSADKINPYAQNPTQGVISVANYDDGGNATRAGSLATDSSRGNKNDPAWLRASSWPDVSAPGENIVSTRARSGAYVAQPALAYEPWYTLSSGTSMAAPHVAGIAALLLQARPSLAPSDVEQLLEDHADEFAVPGGYVSDPSSGVTGVNYAAGHGLVDAVSCLLALGATGGSATPQVAQHPHVYIEGADAQIAAASQWNVPRGVAVQLSEWQISTGNVAQYPLKASQLANFKVFPSVGAAVNLTTVTIAEGGGDYHFSRTWTFATPGDYRIESQLFFGGAFHSFDSWVVHVK